MAQRSRLLFMPVAAVVIAYALSFPLLTIDTLARVASRATAFEAGNLLLVGFLEVSRLIVSVVGIALAIYLLKRQPGSAAARALALFLLFAAISYEKAFGGSAYPGDVQQAVTLKLIEAGVSTRLLGALFGAHSWTLWPTLAALLRFAAVYPHDLRPATLEASGQQDRRGLLRGAGVAGLDIGALFRRASKRLLLLRAYEPRSLIAFAAVMIAAHGLLDGRRGEALVWLIGGFALCIVITNLRAAYLAAEGADRVRVTWILEAGVLALFIYLSSTLLYALVPANVTRMVAFVMIMLTPAAVMTCLALSVLDRRPHDVRSVLHATARWGTIALVVLLGFAVLYRVFGWAADRFGMSRAMAGLAAAGLTALGFDGFRHAADRLRLRVLERSADGIGNRG
ncbi:MAG: hypothetical protein ACT443_04955 [Gemmatimonadota bacterium]